MKRETASTAVERRLIIEHAAGRALAESGSIAEAAPKIIRAICEALEWACGARWMLDPDNNVMVRAESWGIASPDIASFLDETSTHQPARRAGGVVRRAWTEGLPVWIADVTLDPTFQRTAEAAKAGLRSAFAFPIKADAEVVGVLEFFSRQAQPIDPELLSAGVYIGNGIGQFLQRKQAEEALRRFRTAIDLSGDAIYLVDRATMRYIDVSETACRRQGYTREEMLKKGPADILTANRQEIELDYDELIANGGASTMTEFVVKTKDGRLLDVEVQRLAMRSDDRWIICSISRDVTSRKFAENSALRLGRMYAVLGATNEAIMRSKSPEELYQKVCDAAVHGGKFINTSVLLSIEGNGVKVVGVTGKGAAKLLGSAISLEPAATEGGRLVDTALRTREVCVNGDFLDDERTRIWKQLGRQKGVRAAAAVPLLRDDRSIGAILFYSDEKNAFDVETVTLLARLAENIAFALDNFDRDSERKQAEGRIRYLATHDELTGLPNRLMFSELLSLEIESSRRYDRKFTVLFIDLDRFKFVNDTLGHQAGDALLVEMAARLRGALRASDVIARLGGDEFVVLLREVSDHVPVTAVARKILSAALKPMDISGQECRVTASIGIAMYPSDAQDDQSLMKNADLAMYLAKEEGKNNYQFYSAEIQARSIEKLGLESGLRGALERNEFSLHYQAKLDLTTEIITGVEALLRWNSAELGAVTPMQFIPVAEETGLIVPIGKWVLETACAQSVAWQRQGLPPLCMAVNLSPRQFTDPDLIADLGAVLKETGLAPELLELELTESMVMHNTDRAVKLLTAIKALGVRLAIDDFGTGYSSLAQLKRFPIDTLKVDRSFIRDIPHDAEDKAITEAIIALGRILELTVVAEGVETKEQQTFLREHACDEMQGYYFSKPVVPERFAELLRENTLAHKAA